MRKPEARISHLIQQIGINENAGVEVLKIAAEYLTTRERMPDELADFIAKSFKTAASQYRDERISQLGYDLGLTKVGASSKKIHPLDVAIMVTRDKQVSETQLKKEIAKKCNVSESTALKQIKKAKDAHERIHEILKSCNKLVIRNPRKTD